jgi:hypothetical protein
MNWLKTKKWLTLTILFLLAASWTYGEEGQLIRYKFQEGDVLRYKVTNTQSSEMMGTKAFTETIGKMQMKVVAIEGDVASLEIMMTHMRGKMSNPMQGSVEFDTDSEDKGSDPFSVFNQILVGKKFTIKKNSKGKLLSVEGTAELTQEIAKKIKEVGGEGIDPSTMKAVLDNMETEDFWSQMAGPDFLIPEKAVQQGSEWKFEKGISFPPVSLLMKTTCSVKSIQSGVMKTDITGTVEMKPFKEDEAADEQNPMASMAQMMKIVDGKISGNLEFNTDKGLIVKQAIKTTYQMDMMGQKLPISSEQVYELLGVESTGKGG